VTGHHDAQVRVSAPAKINLSLAVGPVRDDGYHPLATVYQAVGLYDEVVVRPAGTPTVTVDGDGVDAAAVPVDGDNLALRAVRLLAEHHDTELTAALHLHKRIPVAGGLAGGSTDAAAALVGVDALFALQTPRSTLLELAARLGSDVPFCLLGGVAMGSGRGELVTPVMTAGEYWWVVVPDRGGLSTPSVFAELDRLAAAGDAAFPTEPEIDDELLAALRAGDPRRLGAALSNDLERAALSLRPDLAERLRVGREAGALGSLVSGSGPTTLFLCEGPEQAGAVDAYLQQECGTVPGLVVTGPVHGARVTGSHGTSSW
jgi:4-diphosphocytidyl-2-C-methyl-D-erythritol kinase